MRCGTRDGRTLSRRRRLDPRLLVVPSRRARDRAMGARFLLCMAAPGGSDLWLAGELFRIASVAPEGAQYRTSN
jgi:hypothetical protein